MKDILSLMQNQSDFYALKGASSEEVERAEQELRLRFAEDYRQYVLAFGAVSLNGHELTGVCNAKRLNVVNVTNDERERNVSVPDEWYVLEQANIDGIVIWQNATGEVYKTVRGELWSKIFGSLTEYVLGMEKS